MTFETFISYSRRNRIPVYRVVKKLQADGIHLWIDKSLEPGEIWLQELETALASSSTCVVFLGPGQPTPWQLAEIQVAVVRRTEESEHFRIIPTLLPNVSNIKDIPGLLFLKGSQCIHIRHANDHNSVRKLACAIRGSTPEDDIELEQLRYTVVFTGQVDELRRHEVEAIVAHLRKLTEDATITFVKQTPGSICLHLRGTRRGFEKLWAMQFNGALLEIEGQAVRAVLLQSDQDSAFCLFGRIYEWIECLFVRMVEYLRHGGLPLMLIAPLAVAAGFTAHQALHPRKPAGTDDAHKLQDALRQAAANEALARVEVLAEAATSSLDNDVQRSLLLSLYAISLAQRAGVTVRDAERSLRASVLNAERQEHIASFNAVASEHPVAFSPSLDALALGLQDWITVRYFASDRHPPSPRRVEQTGPGITLILPGIQADAKLHLDSEPYLLQWSPTAKLIAVKMDSKGLILSLTRNHDGELQMEIELTLPQLGALEWSPNGARFATASADPKGPLIIWDSTTLKEIKRFDGMGGTTMAWSPDGSRLAVPPRFLGPLRIIDVGHWTDFKISGERSGGMIGLEWISNLELFGASGPRLDLCEIAADPNGGYRFVRLPSLKVSDSFRANRGGGYLAVPRQNNIVEFWDLQNARRPAFVTVGTEVDWSPDGKYAAVPSDDRNVRIWDRDSSEIFQLAGQRRKTTATAWSANGALVGTADGDGNAIVFPTRSLPLHVNELTARAKSLLTRPLTPADCVEFFSTQTCPELMPSK